MSGLLKQWRRWSEVGNEAASYSNPQCPTYNLGVMLNLPVNKRKVDVKLTKLSYLLSPVRASTKWFPSRPIAANLICGIGLGWYVTVHFTLPIP
jgi:hypothetical protein